MANGPQSGAAGISITMPSGVTAFWAAFTQASFQLTLKIVDPDGNTIVDQTGTGLNYDLLGSGYFQIEGSGVYTVYITTDQQNNDTSVIWNETPLNVSNTIYCSTYTFTAEDYGGTDYNDIYLTINWFSSLGR